MKTGKRCPVCGSRNIKEVTVGHPERERFTVRKQAESPTSGDVLPSGEPRYKCGDCYRKFEKADEKLNLCE